MTRETSSDTVASAISEHSLILISNGQNAEYDWTQHWTGLRPIHLYSAQASRARRDLGDFHRFSSLTLTRYITSTMKK